MGKKVIGIDIDGTLADSTSAWLAEVERRHNIRATKKELIDYHHENIFSAVKKEEVREIYTKIWDYPDNIKLEDSQIPSILSRIREKFTIYITTATSGEDSAVRAWLAKNNILYDYFLHFSSHNEKHMAQEVNLYIDDYAEVALKVSSIGKQTILLRQPWNRAFIKENKDPNILVADNWKDIERILFEKFA